MNFREGYGDYVRRWQAAPLIKVLVGMRRTGKSVMLAQVADLLKTQFHPPEAVHRFDMELLANARFRDAFALHEHLQGLPKGAVLIDEVQEISGWERLSASLLAEGWEVWLTGSNARMLSSDLATHLTGRFIEIPVWPLGWKEFGQFRGTTHPEEFDRFLRWGGLPGLHHLPWEPDLSGQYLQTVYESILLRDVVARFAVRNVPLLERLFQFVADSVGSPHSASSIAKFLKSQRLSLSADTVDSYVGYLEAAHLVHRVPRWDVRGKRLLEVSEKLYLGDTGLFQAVLGRSGEIGAVLENLVFLELRRRGCRVSVGKVGEHEIDFVAEKNGQTSYLQVAWILADDKTKEREVRPLLAVDDHHPKWVLTLDPLPVSFPAGIRHLDARRFLGGEQVEAGVLG
ncbi:MAG TPA: ATP-binding protein [Fibrobacteria bacterium]|nr:ATP-binding protein [Fibrobacteria bacterium]HOX51636.1 ATP-binding protein [Fibrobacteria bacterium]